jgi:predicted PurR-regulated permease PerM
MMPYLAGVLGAITMYILLRKPMKKLVKKGWKSNLAAAFLLVMSFIVILIPLSGIIYMLGNKIGQVTKNSEKVRRAIHKELNKVEHFAGFEFSSQIEPASDSSWISESLQNFAGGTFTIAISIAIMYFMLYYMLTNRKQLRESLYTYIPIKHENLQIIGKDLQSMVKANALGIPLVAISQGIIALIGFIIFDIESPLFWFVMVTVGSMIPFVGSLLGVVPAFILTYAANETFNAWGILLYGIVVVGSTDNIIRLYVLKRLDNVHPLITLIGVIVGVPLFGFIGLIFGPILISLFLIIVKIYKREYHDQRLIEINNTN